MIILGGGGDEKVAFDSHKYFYESLGSQKKVLYIPVAMDPNEHSWSSCFNWFNLAFSEIGNISINMLTEFRGLSFDFLSQYEGVYVGGGNTFKLLNIFKSCDFDQLLIQYINNGGIYYGGSAGAIIMGKTIDTATDYDTNEVGLKDLNGLNLVDDYSIWPHYISDNKQIVTNWRKSNGKVICIGEDSALIINNQNHEFLGDNVVKLD